MIPLRRWRLILCTLAEPIFRSAAFVLSLVGYEPEGVEMKLRGAALGGAASGWRIGRNNRFVIYGNNFKMGLGVSVYGETYFNCARPGGFIEIGRDSHIDVKGVLYGQGGLTVGEGCAIASGVIVYSQSNADVARDGTPVTAQPVVYAPVIIERGAWLGAGVRVMPGVVVGEASRIGAGAVVIRDVPPYVSAVGIPARVLTSPS